VVPGNSLQQRVWVVTVETHYSSILQVHKRQWVELEALEEGVPEQAVFHKHKEHQAVLPLTQVPLLGRLWLAVGAVEQVASAA
jgi:hypothetical protein